MSHVILKIIVISSTCRSTLPTKRTKLYIALTTLLKGPQEPWRHHSASPVSSSNKKAQQVSSRDIRSSFTQSVTFLAPRRTPSCGDVAETSVRRRHVGRVVLVLRVGTTRSLVRNCNEWPNVIKLALIRVKLDLTPCQHANKTLRSSLKNPSRCSQFSFVNCISRDWVWRLQANAHSYEQIGHCRAGGPPLVTIHSCAMPCWQAVPFTVLSKMLWLCSTNLCYV
jgi:hypothetical protein